MGVERKIIIATVAVCWVVLTTAMHWVRSKFLLEKWAAAHGYKLVKMKMNWIGLSPFLASGRQGVYRIRVKDHSGRERHGWAKCGGYWLGFLVDKVEVELH